MSEQRIRFVEFERGQIDMETGEFPMTLATDGEASDGDILSIEGASFNARAPLQLSHINDPTATLGTVSGFRRELTGSPKRLRARGQIELTGDGPNAEIRRDLAHMIQQGHVTGISVRWEPIRFQRRTSLPKEHAAYVKEDDPDFRKRMGLYHDRWRVLEGSVVAVQADKAAMIGRAEETEGEVSKFWRAMAEDAQSRDALEDSCVSEPKPEPEPEPAPIDNSARLAALAAQIRELREQHGIALEQISDLVEEQRAQAEPTLAEAIETISALRTRIEALENGRETSSPPELLNPIRFLEALKQETEELVAKTDTGMRAYLEMQRGRVLDDEGMRAAAEYIEARLAEIRAQGK